MVGGAVRVCGRQELGKEAHDRLRVLCLPNSLRRKDTNENYNEATNKS